MSAQTYGGANGATYGETDGSLWSGAISLQRFVASGGAVGGSVTNINSSGVFTYGGTNGSTYGGFAGSKWSGATAVERTLSSGSTGGSEIDRTAIYDRLYESGSTGGSEIEYDLRIATEDIKNRLAESLKTPWSDYANNELTRFGALFEAVAFEIALIRRTRALVEISKYIDEATDKQLDRLGDQLDIKRNAGETDSQYRTRIRTAFSASISSGTTPQLIKTIEAFLGSETSVSLNQVAEPATAEIELDQGVFNNKELSVEEFLDRLGPLAAGGVRLQTSLKGTFQFASDTAVSSADGFATLDSGSGDGTATKDDIIEGSGGSWTTFIAR